MPSAPAKGEEPHSLMTMRQNSYLIDKIEPYRPEITIGLEGIDCVSIEEIVNDLARRINGDLDWNELNYLQSELALLCQQAIMKMTEIEHAADGDILKGDPT